MMLIHESHVVELQRQVETKCVILAVLWRYFSKSWIIHEEKTKEITTVRDVWICDPNYHKIQRTFALISPRIINALRSSIKHSKECFIRYPNTSKLVKKNSAAASFFSTHFSVFEYLMKHSSSCLIYYLKQNKTKQSAIVRFCSNKANEDLRWLWLRLRKLCHLIRASTILKQNEK